MAERAKILHISDLHVSSNDADQQLVLTALYKSIELLVSQDGPLDLVVFSGDLAAKGNFSPSVRSKILAFLAQVVKSAELSEKSRLLVCPGNHDVNVKDRTAFFTGALDAISSREAVNQFVEDPVSEALRPLDGFKSVLTEFYGESPYSANQLHYTRNLLIGSAKVGVAILNSAWRARGLSENKDYGYLMLGERQIEQSLKEIAGADLKIAVLHHPTHWLSLVEQSHIQRLFSANFQAVMCGHNHNSEATNIANGHTVFVTSNAGCLYQSRDYFNGYSLLTFSFPSQAVEIRAFEYFRERELFTLAERFGEGGVREFVLSTDTSLFEFAKPEVVDKIRQRVDMQLLSSTASSVAPKSLNGVFVDPLISTTSEVAMGRGGERDGDKTPFLRLEDLVRQEARLHLLGRRESGKTTILNRIALDASTLQLPGVFTGCVIDCSKLSRRKTSAGILELATHFYGSEVSVKNVRRLAEAGQIVFCFDEFDYYDDSIRNLLIDFMQTYPKARFVFASTEIETKTFSANADKDVANSRPLFGKVAFIQSFRRRQTKELVKRWFGADERSDERLDQISNHLRRLGVPRTPFLVSLILWVLENRPSKEPINQAAVVDAMVDGLLGKLTESKDRSRIDARLKTLFLIDLAHTLYQRKEIRLERAAIEQFITDYFRSKGWKESAFELLTELLEKGFLIELDGQVQFKFDCFRAFFLGQKLNDDKDFFDAVMTREKFSHLQVEIDYATGLVRNRRDFLDTALAHCKAMAAAFEYFGDSLALDNASTSAALYTDEMTKSMENQIDVIDADGTRREEFLDDLDDTMAPTPAPSDQVSRDTEKAMGLIQGLLTLSVVLRNSEAVDGEAKAKALKWLVATWASLLAHGYTQIESEKIRSALAEKFSDDVGDAAKAEHYIRVLGPMIAIGLFEEFVATPKLASIFEQSYESADSALERLIYLSFMLNVQSEDCIADLKDFFGRGDKSTVWKEIAYFKAVGSLMMKKWSPDRLQLLKTVLIDRLGDVTGKASFNKAFALQQIDKKLSEFQKERS